MKLHLPLIPLLVLHCCVFLSGQTSISGIVNSYTPVLAFSGCDRHILQVGSSSDFQPGDKVLLIQMKGASVSLDNNSTFGSVTQAAEAGSFGINRIKSISGNQITLLYKPEKAYDVNGKVQLVRVPEYVSATATNLTCKPWDGTTGGVLIIDVADTLTLENVAADVSAKGFRGGMVADGNDYSVYHQTGYYYTFAPDTCAQKGEGIADVSPAYQYGRGRLANGGGGGNAHNAGGGGGANGAAGGNGGLEYWFFPNSPTPGTNGVGGAGIFNTNGQKILMGGGGGAGHTNDQVGTSGGDGGGIIIIKATYIQPTGNNTALLANGANVVSDGTNRNDGQGGGGAGGSIFIQAGKVLGPLHCDLKGGTGGDCLFYVTEQIIGPGGGGGGGRLLMSFDFPNVTANLNGGANGIANQNNPNGAQPGQAGNKLTGIVIPKDTDPAAGVFVDTTIVFCPGSSVTIDGVTYTQPGTVTDTIPGVSGCDSLIVYYLQYAPLDAVFKVKNLVCSEGRIDLSYSLCNLGSGLFPENMSVTFYDANPLTGPAKNLGLIVFGTAGLDGCLNATLSDALSSLPLENGMMLYSVVNFEGSPSPPFSFDDFPVTGIEECNYHNNLDSFLVQLPNAPVLDLGPDVVLCQDSTVVFNAGSGFFSYLWSDGSTGASLAATLPDYYWVEVTDECGFKQRDTVLLTVSLLPDTQFPDTAVCGGSSIALSLPGFDTYAWSPATGLSCTDCADVTISPAGNTTYSVVATTAQGCILHDTFTVIVLPINTVDSTISFCPGEVVTIGGVNYSQSATVMDTTTGGNGCALITHYTLVLLPQPTLAATIEFCQGETVVVNGNAYSQPGTVTDTLPSLTGGCDTVATYTLVQLPLPTLAATIQFCQGETVVVNGTAYSQPGTVTDTLPSLTGGCDTVATYTLVQLPLPALAATIAFCKGETVILQGVPYTQPAVITLTLPGVGEACDTIATYTLKYVSDPDAAASVDCPADISIPTQPGTGPVTVNYDLPVTASDCPCPGIELVLTEGLPPGSLFPVTTTKVCYQAKDSCGNTATCCFNVTVREEQPCDVKEIGCMKYELLDITRNASNLNLNYRIRVTNKCADKMIYTAIQLPDGVVAVAPANNSVYTSPDNRDYDVRNPNYSPSYSIRFKSKDDSIANGQSDIFRYTLPPQTNPAYIHVVSRIYPQAFYEAHLNTFNCPIEVVNEKMEQRAEPAVFAEKSSGLAVFPNPNAGTFFTDLSEWRGGQVYLQVFDGLGRQVWQQTVTAGEGPQEIRLPQHLAGALYFLEVTTEQGEKRAARFVVERK